MTPEEVEIIQAANILMQMRFADEAFGRHRRHVSDSTVSDPDVAFQQQPRIQTGQARIHPSQPQIQTSQPPMPPPGFQETQRQVSALHPASQQGLLNRSDQVQQSRLIPTTPTPLRTSANVSTPVQPVPTATQTPSRKATAISTSAQPVPTATPTQSRTVAAASTPFQPVSAATTTPTRTAAVASAPSRPVPAATPAQLQTAAAASTPSQPVPAHTMSLSPATHAAIRALTQLDPMMAPLPAPEPGPVPHHRPAPHLTRAQRNRLRQNFELFQRMRGQLAQRQAAQNAPPRRQASPTPREPPQTPRDASQTTNNLPRQAAQQATNAPSAPIDTTTPHYPSLTDPSIRTHPHNDVILHMETSHAAPSGGRVTTVYAIQRRYLYLPGAARLTSHVVSAQRQLDAGPGGWVVRAGQPVGRMLGRLRGGVGVEAGRVLAGLAGWDNVVWTEWDEMGNGRVVNASERVDEEGEEVEVKVEEEEQGSGAEASSPLLQVKKEEEGEDVEMRDAA